ncbi:MAG: helix-turn-helix domain-containing protein [Burkholderiaceae bacterium]|nr:helix-turn-helix domain-containing protein [Burkholderiaceae bacterium]
MISNQISSSTRSKSNAQITKRRMAEQLGLDDERLPLLDAEAIKALRARHNISQAVLASVLNVGLGAVRQWEQGNRHPAGSALKLLHLMEKRGLDLLL